MSDLPLPSPPPSPPARGPLARVLELKRTLSGRVKTFNCRLLSGDRRHAVLLFVAPAPMHVHGVDLPAGTVTFGHFWTDRFYNVYHWLDPAGGTIGFYFNLADSTSIDEGRLEWRDLTLDVLAMPSGRLEVLDEDELPPDLDAPTRAHIESGRSAILGDPRGVMDEIERCSREIYGSVYRAVFPDGARVEPELEPGAA